MRAFPESFAIRRARRNARQTAIAGILAGVVVLAMLVSVMAPEQAAPAAGSTPSAQVDAGFAALRTSAADDATPIWQRPQSKCGDFGFAFMHSKCLGVRTKHARLGHRGRGRA